jgi:hypothetical protein
MESVGCELSHSSSEIELLPKKMIFKIIELFCTNKLLQGSSQNLPQIGTLRGVALGSRPGGIGVCGVIGIG